MVKSVSKALAFSVLSSVVIFLLFTSCSKEFSHEPDLSPDDAASAAVKLENNSFTFTGSKDSSFALTGTIGSTGDEYLSITLTDVTNKMALVMEITPFAGGAGTYDIASGFTDNGMQIASFYRNGLESTPEEDVYFSYVQTGNPENPIIRGNGTLVITSITDNEVKGTFEMSLINYDQTTGDIQQMQIGNGSFRVPIKSLDIN